MTIRSLAGTALLVFGLGIAGAAAASPYQPGMRTMSQQGGVEHGVQPRGSRRMKRRGVRSRQMMRNRQTMPRR